MDVKTLPYWIIDSLLENDLYKFNMNDVICRKFNDYMTKWTFKCRNKDVKFTPEMISEIRRQVDHYCTLRFTKDEIAWLGKNLPWLSKGYLNHLVDWAPKRYEIFINEGNIQSYNDCGLAIEAYGTWLNVSMYEIAILAIVNEVYYAFKYGIGAKDIEFQKRTIEKFGKFFDHITWEHYLNCNDEKCAQEYFNTHPYEIGTFAEFGLRRRLSRAMQDWLIKYCVEQKVPGFVGTSNVYLAKKYGCKCVGTMAHEYIQGMQVTPGHDVTYANHFAMEAWTDCFGVKNGTYLTDCMTTDLFLLDFDEKYATLFNGLRHDSGDPFVWGDKIIAHYKKLGIDPLTKTLLFSDALDFERATKIKKHFAGRCKVAFGIGTWLSNDCGVPTLNIVMKVKECNGFPTCKLTDNPEKAMGDPEFIGYVQRSVDWRIRHEH